MHFSGILLSFTLAAVETMCLEAPIEGYGVQPFTWSVETYPGGPVVEASGTVQDVIAQLSASHPEFVTHYQANLAKHMADLAEDVPQNDTQHAKRGDQVFCNNFPRAYATQIDRGIGDLRAVSGSPTNGPGPGNCGRVSCYTGGNAIWWCNDNRTPKTLPGFYNIADGATVVRNTCPWYGGGYIGQQLYSGQDFHIDNWNVIVRGTDGQGSC